MAYGIMQSDGSNITGFSAPVQPDKGFTRQTGMKVLKSQFGDGYELRIADGINTKQQTLNVAFTTRPKAEIDDLVKFFEDLGGVTKFRFDLEDSNEGSSEESIFCICENWSQTWAFDNFYTLQATFRRVYEA
jgi:phage-related protein|tara:strand:+ start:185 stop:580 length:396 start_codon:yes stop_codon:yes gene_type:complete